MKNTIDIPDNVLVRCPKVNFVLARLANCNECASFAGLLDRFPGGQHKAAQRYLLQCRFEPVKRELFELGEVVA